MPLYKLSSEKRCRRARLRQQFELNSATRQWDVSKTDAKRTLRSRSPNVDDRFGSQQPPVKCYGSSPECIRSYARIKDRVIREIVFHRQGHLPNGKPRPSNVSRSQ